MAKHVNTANETSCRYNLIRFSIVKREPQVLNNKFLFIFEFRTKIKWMPKTVELDRENQGERRKQPLEQIGIVHNSIWCCYAQHIWFFFLLCFWLPSSQITGFFFPNSLAKILLAITIHIYFQYTVNATQSIFPGGFCCLCDQFWCVHDKFWLLFTARLHNFGSNITADATKNYIKTKTQTKLCLIHHIYGSP